MAKTEQEIQRERKILDNISDSITEFLSRQVITVTKFERACRKKKPSHKGGYRTYF